MSWALYMAFLIIGCMIVANSPGGDDDDEE